MRKFANQKISFRYAAGGEMTLGYWSDGGKEAIKLRLPEPGWKVSQVFGPVNPEDDSRPTIVVLERG